MGGARPTEDVPGVWDAGDGTRWTPYPVGDLWSGWDIGHPDDTGGVWLVPDADFRRDHPDAPDRADLLAEGA